MLTSPRQRSPFETCQQVPCRRQTPDDLAQTRLEQFRRLSLAHAAACCEAVRPVRARRSWLRLALPVQYVIGRRVSARNADTWRKASCAQRRVQCTYPRVRQSRKQAQDEQLFPGNAPALFAPSNLSLPSLLPSDNLYSTSLTDPTLNYSSHLFIPPLPSSDLNSNRTTTLLPSVHSE